MAPLQTLRSSLSNGCSVFVCAEYFTSNPSRHATSISIYLFASFYLPQNLLIFSEVIFSLLPFSLSFPNNSTKMLLIEPCAPVQCIRPLSFSVLRQD